jgi:hypothetical protein
VQPPVLDPRTREDVLERALELARADLPDWPGYAPDWAAAADPADPGMRLVELFARLAELLIDRLNRVPERNFLSFLELTGVERSPGVPAEVPVTFMLSKRAPLGGLVPAGTQVATIQTEKSDARVFETRRDIFVTPARIDRIVALHPATDRFTVLPLPPLPPDADELAAARPVTVLSDAEPALEDVAHILYLGSEALFGRPDAVDVDVTFELAAGRFPDDIEWLRYHGEVEAWTELTPPEVTAAGNAVTFRFNGLAGVEPVTIDDVEEFWVAAHFVGPFDEAFDPPVIVSAMGAVSAPTQPLTQFDAAFHNAEALDLSKPYHPFGRRPAYGDAFYFGSRIAFARDVETVDLFFSIRPRSHVELAAQFAGLADALSVRTVARWQYLNDAGQWVDLATYDHEYTFAASSGDVTQTSNAAPPGAHAGDGTFLGGSSGAGLATVRLTGFQGDIGLQTVHGIESCWVRVLLMSDAPYGIDGVLVSSGAVPQFVGPLLIPPTIEAVSIDYVPSAALAPVGHMKALNNFALRDAGALGVPFQPFESVAGRDIDDSAAFGAEPALYFAFDRSPGTAFVSVFFDLADRASALISPIESGQPNVAWEYWRATAGWAPLDVDDATLDLTTSGTVAFVTPGDATPVALFEQVDPDGAPNPAARWWFRARLVGGGFDHPPAVRGIYLNTTMADNRSTSAELLVGSSNGEPNQTFALVRGPVLAGELWVREMERPGGEELRALEAEHRADSVMALGPADVGPVLDVRPVEGSEPEIWVRWRRAATLRASRPRSRHYTVDSVAAVVTFGSGVRGLIPPVGRNNLVLRDFRTGGGEAANRDTIRLAVRELKTSLPFIDRVFNVQSASAGASPWTVAQLTEFGPQILKNRGRPVTTEDYEWMVRQRFSQIARVRCLPVRAPAPGGGLRFSAGAVTVLIVPSSTERRPQPGQGLIRNVREFLAQIALGTIAADIHVKGPDYTPVDIEATLVPTRPELASVVVRRAAAAIEAFLHPLTGGEEGAGYGFGRPVYLSEVHAVLERIDEVDHVISAAFSGAPGADAFPIDSERLASSGTHSVSV